MNYNTYPIFDTYEDEQAYYDHQIELERNSTASKYHQKPPRNKPKPKPVEHSIEPALLGGEKGGKTSWVIRDFLAEGACVLLAAEAGSGKSSLIYSAAEAIQEGQPFLDQLPVNQGKVLIIQGDEPPQDAQSKFRRMDLEARFELSYLDEPLNIEWLRNQANSKRYKAIFIDSATSVLATNDLDVTDLGFSRKLYEIGKISSESSVGIIITCHLNKPSEGQIRKVVTKHDISGVATIAAAISDIWGLWGEPIPQWESHFNMKCLGKRNCREDTVWMLEGSEEDYSWFLKESGNGEMLPKARIILEDKIAKYFSKNTSPLPLKLIAKELNTKYEYARRCCTDLFDEGKLSRVKEKNGKQGRPTYLYGPPE